MELVWHDLHAGGYWLAERNEDISSNLYDVEPRGDGYVVIAVNRVEYGDTSPKQVAGPVHTLEAAKTIAEMLHRMRV